MDAGGYCWQGNELLLRVRAQPRASRDEWMGLWDDRFRVRIAAPPVDGRANAHLRAFLAELFGVAKNHGVDSRAPMHNTAPIGASRPHRIRPEPVMKLPMLHWATKGKNRNKASCVSRNHSKCPQRR